MRFFLLSHGVEAEHHGVFIRWSGILVMVVFTMMFSFKAMVDIGTNKLQTTEALEKLEKQKEVIDRQMEIIEQQTINTANIREIKWILKGTTHGAKLGEFEIE